jgi:hypothetical protein
MRRRGLTGLGLGPALGALILGCAGVALVARAQLPPQRPRHLSDARWGVAVDLPAGWSVSQRTGYAETVFLLVFPDGSRISLSAEKTSARTAGEILERNRRALAQQGFLGLATLDGPGAWRTLDFEVPGKGDKGDKNDKNDRPEKVRQLYLVRPGSTAGSAISVIVTLTAPTRTFASHLADVAFVVERTTFEAPEPERPSPPSSVRAVQP